MDDDGDVDVLAATYGPSDIYWADNDGSQSFVTRAVGFPSGPWDAYPADVDGDGDVDVAGRAERRYRRPLDAPAEDSASATAAIGPSTRSPRKRLGDCRDRPLDARAEKTAAALTRGGLGRGGVVQRR